MNLYLLRHGIAVSAEETAPDGERPLTAKGIKRMRKAARGLRRLGLDFDAILTSPLARARQTADIVAAALGLESHLTVVEALQPNCSVEELLASLSDYQHRKHLLLVGHEPLLSGTAAFLRHGQENGRPRDRSQKGRSLPHRDRFLATPQSWDAPRLAGAETAPFPRALAAPNRDLL